MANNRMYLVHVPTGKSVYLGKRMALGYYMTKENMDTLGERVQCFFESTIASLKPDQSQDDFVLALEDFEEAPHAAEITEYPGDGVMKVKFK